MPSSLLNVDPQRTPAALSPQARTPCGTATLINGVWVFADDTPSRHPCKRSVTRNSKKRRFIFNPYGAQVVLGQNLEQTNEQVGGKKQPKPTGPIMAPTSNEQHHDSDDSDGVVETAFDDVLTNNNNNTTHRTRSTPPPPPQQARVAISITPDSVSQFNAPFLGFDPRKQSTTTITPAGGAQNILERCPPLLPQHRTSPPPEQLQDATPAVAATDRGIVLQQKAYLVRFKFAVGLFAAPLPTNKPQEETPEGTDSDHEEETQQQQNNKNSNKQQKSNKGEEVSEQAGSTLPRKKHNAPYAEGDLVVVEGDRGENIGVITEVGLCEDSDRLQQLPLIIRHCMNKDRKRYYHARRKDAVASRSAQQYARELGLPMNILDAEFQVDLQKLTLYYRCYQPTNNNRLTQQQQQDEAHPVDFRQLQRSLYKIFRCRIWLVNWDSDPRLQEIVKQHVMPPSMKEPAHQAQNESFHPAPQQQQQFYHHQQHQHQQQQAPQRVPMSAPAQFQSMNNNNIREADWASRLLHQHNPVFHPQQQVQQHHHHVLSTHSTPVPFGAASNQTQRPQYTDAPAFFSALDKRF